MLIPSECFPDGFPAELRDLTPGEFRASLKHPSWFNEFPDHDPSHARWRDKYPPRPHERILLEGSHVSTRFLRSLGVRYARLALGWKYYSKNFPPRPNFEGRVVMEARDVPLVSQSLFPEEWETALNNYRMRVYNADS